MSFSYAAGRAAVNGLIGPGFHVVVLSRIRQSPGDACAVMTSATWLKSMPSFAYGPRCSSR
jgi:hypothetical protein